MIWEEFKHQAPEMAALGEERFERTGVVLLGTLKKDGWPRISPVEVLITDGHLFMGMIWRSRKALDLLRDARCAVHNAITSREGTDGEFKLYGRAIEIRDLDVRRRYGDALYAKIGWKPDEPEFHLFSLDIESASFTEFRDGELIATRWMPGGGMEVVKRWKPNS
jgi:hypothetical protein